MWESIENPPITLDAYRALLAGWEVFPVCVGSQIVGAVIRVGTELHVGWKRRPPGAQRALIRSILVDTIERYGWAVTSVRWFNRAGLEFCSRLGFSITHQTGEIIHLKCERARHA